MSTLRHIRKDGRIFTAHTFSVAAVWCILAFLSTRAVSADDAYGKTLTLQECPGTYLIKEGNGTLSLWTLSLDGTFQGTSSAESVLGFSHQQGVWTKTGPRKARATLLDFTFNPQALEPSNIARVDIRLVFGKRCQEVEGSFELRFFDPATEDPLDVRTDTGDPITDTFTGRRLIVRPFPIRETRGLR